MTGRLVPSSVYQSTLKKNTRRVEVVLLHNSVSWYAVTTKLNLIWQASHHKKINIIQNVAKSNKFSITFIFHFRALGKISLNVTYVELSKCRTEQYECTYAMQYPTLCSITVEEGVMKVKNTTFIDKVHLIAFSDNSYWPDMLHGIHQAWQFNQSVALYLRKGGHFCSIFFLNCSY